LFATETERIEQFELDTGSLPAFKIATFVQNNPQLRSFQIYVPFKSRTEREQRVTAAAICLALLEAPLINCIYIGDGYQGSIIPRMMWSTLSRRDIDFRPKDLHP